MNSILSSVFKRLSFTLLNPKSTFTGSDLTWNGHNDSGLVHWGKVIKMLILLYYVNQMEVDGIRMEFGDGGRIISENIANLNLTP